MSKKPQGEEKVDITENARENEEHLQEKINELENKCKSYENEMEELNSKFEEEKNNFLRLAAEYDNYKKRTAKEKLALSADITSDVINKLLPVIDDMQRAFITDNASIESIQKGLEMIVKKSDDCLKSLGVEEIECIGKPFDPNLQNAVMHVEDENFGEQIVVEVFKKGYKMGDKVIRYAMVKVAN